MFVERCNVAHLFLQTVTAMHRHQVKNEFFSSFFLVFSTCGKTLSKQYVDGQPVELCTQQAHSVIITISFQIVLYCKEVLRLICRRYPPRCSALLILESGRNELHTGIFVDKHVEFSMRMVSEMLSACSFYLFIFQHTQIDFPSVGQPPVKGSLISLFFF